MLLTQGWISRFLQSKFVQRSTYYNKHTAGYNIYASIFCKNCQNVVLALLFSRYSDSKSCFSLKFIDFYQSATLRCHTNKIMFNQVVNTIFEEPQLFFVSHQHIRHFFKKVTSITLGNKHYFCAFEYPGLGLFLVCSYYLPQPDCFYEIYLSTKISEQEYKSILL